MSTPNYEELFKDIPSPQKEELIRYYQAIQELANKKVKTQFKNEGEYHAAAVMSLLFNHSKETINVFAGNFQGNVCSKKVYMDSLVEAFTKHPKLELSVIFEKTPIESSEGYKNLIAIKKKYPDRVSVKIADKDQLKKYIDNTHNQKIAHFAVGDKSIYRYEMDTANYKAYCDFNDETFSKNLLSLFSILNVNAKEILN